MNRDEALGELVEWASGLSVGGLRVHRVGAGLDERQDGEEVTRVVLIVDDPKGETWELGETIELRQALGRKATELGLPAVSVTLAPESEADSVERFVR